jgi:segregation and condensation protein A
MTDLTTSVPQDEIPTVSVIEENADIADTADKLDHNAYAKVLGIPMFELPQDLYIPPEALQVFLEAFEGPLDLLLYLIKRQNLNILDIPIAEVTRQYIEYVEIMRLLYLELAAEYLVMAATLAEIKSRMLLPRPESLAEEEDPRAELIRRLQEYERFKRTAENVDSLPRVERDLYTAHADVPDLKAERALPEVDLRELLLAFKDILMRTDLHAHHHIKREALSVRERMTEILDRLRQTSFLKFEELFRYEEGRAGVVVAFIAILELLKGALIEMVQTEPLAPIHIRGIT